MGAVDHWIPASTSHSLPRCGILSTAPAPQPVLHGAPVVKLITEPLPLLWEQWMAKPQRQGISRVQDTFTVNLWSEALEAPRNMWKKEITSLFLSSSCGQQYHYPLISLVFGQPKYRFTKFLLVVTQVGVILCCLFKRFSKYVAISGPWALGTRLSIHDMHSYHLTSRDPTATSRITPDYFRARLHLGCSHAQKRKTGRLPQVEVWNVEPPAICPLSFHRLGSGTGRITTTGTWKQNLRTRQTSCRKKCWRSTLTSI